MNGTRNSRNEKKKRRTPTILETSTGESYPFPILFSGYHPVFRLKYIGQALFFNLHFLTMILVGIFGMIFTPLKTSIEWINENINFLNAVILGVGVGGIICWCFVYKFKKEFSKDISTSFWIACYVLLNICHIMAVLFFLGFFLSVGIKENGSISSLACGVFSSTIAGIMLSIKYAVSINSTSTNRSDSSILNPDTIGCLVAVCEAQKNRWLKQHFAPSS